MEDTDLDTLFSPALPAIWLLFAFLSVMLGSRWIDMLYEKNPGVLSFPGEISERARLRKMWLFAALAISFMRAGFFSVSIVVAFYLAAASLFLLLMTATDFEQYAIFDAMTYTFAFLGLLSSFHLHADLFDRTLAAGAGGLVFFLLALLTRGGIGGGDVKLIAALGLWLGTERLVGVVTVGLVAGGIAAFLMLILKKKSRGSVFAYGPYFALTALVSLLFDGL